MKNRAEMTNVCRQVFTQIQDSRSQINNSCMSTKDKLDLLSKSAKNEYELQKICFPYVGLGITK